MCKYSLLKCIFPFIRYVINTLCFFVEGYKEQNKGS